MNLSSWFSLAVRTTVALALTTVLASVVNAQSVRQITAADLPRIPPTEPEDALKTFKLARGFHLELVAAEPMVADPVDACFDEFGQMFVAEMHGYPFSQEPTKLNPAGGGKPDAGIIRMLADDDGDGRMDRSVVFADQLSWPTSVCCYDGGLFVLAPPHLYYFKDLDGDHRADVREVVLSGFGRDNVQSLANGLRWGLDNLIYFAAGRNPAVLEHRGRALFSASGRDVRFDPRTEEFELVSGGQQFGHSIDDWGNRFVCSNSNHIQHVVFPQRYLARNPQLAVPRLVRDIAQDGASARVFRTSLPEPWRIVRQKWRALEKGYRLVVGEDGAWRFLPLDPSHPADGIPTEYPVGYFTSATGIMIYRGDAYPAEFHGNAFVGDVGGNLVHRKVVTPRGVTFAANRADSGEEFLRSSDNWFRPVNFVNAPDGTLYALDMYRETVEHPYSIPAEIKKFLHLQSGSERGRIYRIVSPDRARSPVVALAEKTNDELVASLESDNSWRRETAQRLLCERRAASVAPSLAALARTSSRPLARVHALYTLAGLESLTPAQLLGALRDSNPRVREHAIRLAEPLLRSSPTVVEALLDCARDPDDRVRFQLALSLGDVDSASVIGALAEIAFQPALSGEIQTAILSSVPDTADQLAGQILSHSSFQGQPSVTGLLSNLSLIAGAHPNPSAAEAMLVVITHHDVASSLQQSLLASFGEGLARRGNSFTKLLDENKLSPQVRQQVDALFDRAAKIAVDERRSAGDRIEAIGVFAFADYATAASRLKEFLLPHVSAPFQQAAIRSLAFHDAEESAVELLTYWQSYSPMVKGDVIDGLLRHRGHASALLAAISSGKVARRDLTREDMAFLLSHPDADIRAQSDGLLGDDAPTDRSQVVESYQHVLELDGDASRGLTLFGVHCASCHRIGTKGHLVAPELASVSNKSPADLLVAILDPNREAQPNFTAYSLVTNDGRIHRGIIVAETATSITLRRAEGREEVILRSNIDELNSTGRSLMPDGFEKQLSPQDIADTIALVKSIQIKQ